MAAKLCAELECCIGRKNGEETMKKRIVLFAIIMALMLGMLTVSAAADDAGAYEEMPDNFVILLDCSRSLETNDPQNLCLQACKNFVDKLPSQNAKVSVVAFGYRDGEAYTFSADYGISAHDKNSELIHTIIPLGDLNSTEATSEYKAIVESTNANNRGNSKTWTPISYAIAASVDMLEKASVQDGKACIILVSDGVNEPYGIGNAEGGYSMVWDDRLVESASLKAGNHQWTIYSIALNYGNKDAVETRKAASYLDKICANSGARNVGVIACEKPIDVHVAFQRIFRDFYRLAQKDPTVIKLPGSYSFQIPELTSEACVDIFSEDTTTNIESVKLVNVTDGTETWINKNIDDSNLVAVIEEGSYYSVKMFCPKAGEWKVEVYGDNDARVLVSSTEIKEMGLKMQTTPSNLSTAMNKGDSIAPFLSSAFISNANAPANKNTRNTSTLMIDGKMVPVERSGSTHEFPKCFAAIGFASAAVPKKIVRAYVVKKICEQAGIKPVSPADYAAMAAKADGTMLLPFRGMDDMPNGETGSAEAKAIIKPIANIHKIVHTSLFDYIRDLKLDPEEVTWKAIHDGKYSYTANTALIENMVANYTSTNEMNKLNATIRSAFSDYRKNVCDYVKNEGPYAFANIYYGNFKGAEGGARYKGIRELLQDLVAADGVTPMAYPSSNAAACLERLQNIENTIRGGNKLSIDLKGKKSEQLSAWLRAYNMWVNARINEKRAKAVYKSAGELKRSFLDPANILAEQVMTFGDVLSTMADIYEASGDKMEGFQAFSNATDSVTEVNIAAVDISAYNWLKQQADDDVARLKAKNFRDSLVDNFFADPGKWLDVPENSATKDNGANKARLINPDKPVPAREVFDTFATEYIQLSVNTSIEQLFENQQEIGNSYAATAERIMQELYSKSKPRFDGQIPQSNTVFKYIKYPVALDNNAGNIPQIKTALVAAAQSVAGIQAGNIYPSYDSDAIMLYQQATTMEIYLLNNLANWEKEYELSCKNQAERLTLHGKSPDVERVALEDGTIYYKEYTPWTDYPSIVQRDDPEKRDANGELCHDGAVRLKEKELIEKAKEYGVLYSSVDSQGEWVIKRVYCDKTREWNFKITGMMPDPNTGLLPQGKAFADSVAVQNGVTLDSISKNVSLDFAGVLSESAPIEDVAWERAAKVLHAHHPMFCEIRRTCELFEPWFKTVMQKNTELLGSQRPGMFVHLLRGLVVSKTPDGAWVWNKADG